jgi:hypothetical protein
VFFCLFALIRNVNYASTRRSTGFYILFLSSTVSVIYNFSTVPLYGTVDVGIFHTMFSDSFCDTCFANEQFLLKKHFSDAMTSPV